MTERTFDRETLLDLTVNVIPLGIILFFVVVFLVADPWEFDPFITVVTMGLLVVPFVVLALVTYVSGRAVSKAEKREEDTAADSFDDAGSLQSGSSGATAELTDGVSETTADDETDESDDLEPAVTAVDSADTEETDTDTAEDTDSATDGESADETDDADSHDN